MPIHDWSRVGAGIFHDFHLSWIAELKRTLNSGLLPPGYYALAEQVAGGVSPDVIALEVDSNGGPPTGPQTSRLAIATQPPQVRFTSKTEMNEYVRKQNQVVIRHASGDHIVSLVEIVSPGNKASKHALRSFVIKASDALYQGLHLLILDLQPPTPRDPQGIHGAIWAEICDEDFQAPADKPLTLVAYSAGPIKNAFVEPIAVGDPLTDMPLFLEPEAYINVPLERTYQAAFQSVPERWRRVLEE
jgi:hypothetical protein